MGTQNVLLSRDNHLSVSTKPNERSESIPLALAKKTLHALSHFVNPDDSASRTEKVLGLMISYTRMQLVVALDVKGACVLIYFVPMADALAVVWVHGHMHSPVMVRQRWREIQNSDPLLLATLKL